VDISIGPGGIRIRVPKDPASGEEGANIDINLPADAAKEIIKEAISDAREAARDVAEARRDVAGAQQDVADAARQGHEMARNAIEEARRALQEMRQGTRMVDRRRTVHWGDFLTDLALIWIFGSAIIKITYKGRIQAEVKAAQATETAESESLKRQVVEARMAAMQAQVEPHFLFNTLASIDHLIETDPPRASQMQKNLIALLRASMPTMREANASGVRDLGRELAVIRPYLEILKVRMEERLTTAIDVPEGLQSAEFPPMMIQGLVENAIKHGLEPKAEGGHLAIKAEILHGKMAVSVADTGLGFGKAATAGTGVGLANIRERLQLLYGGKASVAVTENQPSGTVVTITVPYKPVEGAPA
jgi:signal transduction histidine kinase